MFPPLPFGTPKNAVVGTLMALATMPCVPEVELRCMMPLLSVNGDTLPAWPQPQISCPIWAVIAVNVVSADGTTMIIACAGPWKSLIVVGCAEMVGQFFQKMSETPTSTVCVLSSEQLVAMTLV